MSFITNAEGNFFVQTKREEVFQWLTCTGVGDIDIPEGDREVVECPDPLNSGLFKLEGFIRGTPGAGSYSLTKPLVRVYNFMMENKCDFVGRINWVARGHRADPLNYELGVLMHGSEFTSRSIVNPVAMTGDEEARINTNGDIEYLYIFPFYPLQVVVHSVANTANAYCVYFLPERCEDRLGSARETFEYGVVGLENAAGYAYDSEVKITTDGSSWAETTLDPFSYGGDVGAVLIFESIEGEKILAFRGSGVVGAPAECATSEDDGESWTNSLIGALNGQYINAAAVREADVVAVASGGYIYISQDQGNTWEAAEEAVETTEDLNDIDFYDKDKGYVVGNDNTFLYTTEASDGADADWASRTGPAVGANLMCVAVNDKGDVFVGASDGVLYVSRDEGRNWAVARNFGPGSVDDIAFDPYADYVGAVIYNNATPRGYLYRSLDGGASFQQISDVPANSGLNALQIVDANRIFIVGDAHDGTTFLAETRST